VSDKEFSSDEFKGRGIILFGNKTTNAAWPLLLKTCPIQMERNTITAGTKTFHGDDIGAYFIWPLANSPLTSVAVIGGTGVRGMNAANGNQYFAGASGFPDYMIFTLDMLRSGSKGVNMAGFYNNSWGLE
jgi:hypothetical protein